MKKKILHQLEYAYVGKPFKTTNHLTYWYIDCIITT
jgi:hypothetical protein